MAEDKTLSDTAKALGIGPLLPAIYGDLLSPAARELGGGLATVAKAVKISLAPLEATIWGYERIREWLSLRVTSILAERRTAEIQPPPLSLAGPLIVQMLFAAEEPDLREMYASLLASAMDNATASPAHPSFVALIQQLTPDEAKIIGQLSSIEEKWPTWAGDQESSDLEVAMRRLCVEANVIDSTNVDLYIENLLRLQLLRRFSGSESEYHPGGWYEHGEYEPSVSTTNFEVIELTAYGRAFLDACVVGAAAQAGGTGAGASRRR
jgi:hypothetical protein